MEDHKLWQSKNSRNATSQAKYYLGIKLAREAANIH